MKLKSEKEIEFKMLQEEWKELDRIFHEIQDEIEPFEFDRNIRSSEWFKFQVKTQRIIHDQGKKLIDAMDLLFED